MNEEEPHDHHQTACHGVAAESGVTDQVVKGIMMLIIPWSVWVTHNIYELVSLHHQDEEDFTFKDAHHLEGEVRVEIQKINDKIWSLENKMSSEYVRESELQLLLDKNK